VKNKKRPRPSLPSSPSLSKPLKQTQKNTHFLLPSLLILGNKHNIRGTLISKPTGQAI